MARNLHTMAKFFPKPLYYISASFDAIMSRSHREISEFILKLIIIWQSARKQSDKDNQRLTQMVLQGRTNYSTGRRKRASENILI